MLAFLRTRKLSLLLLLLDIVMALVALRVSYEFRFNDQTVAFSGFATALVLIMATSIYVTNGYHIKKSLSVLELGRRSLLAFIVGFVIATALIYILGRDYYDPFRGRGILFLTFAIFYAASYLIRLSLLFFLQKSGGKERQWLLISRAAARDELIYNTNVAQVDLQFSWLDTQKVSIKALQEQQESSNWLGVIVENDEKLIKKLGDELGRWRFSGFTLMSIAEFDEKYLGTVSLPQLWPGWFLDASGFILARTSLARRTKGLIDYIIAVLALIVLSPILLIIAIAIKLDSTGPVFYRQERIGVHHVNYQMIKFRSMRVDAEIEGVQRASKNDDRVTKIGRWLRKYRIDELPQLINVLLGDMSLIGPRPERPEYLEDLIKEIPYYEIRHLVKPGITGWAQVRYPYGENTEDAKRKLQYDLYYIKHYSLLLDALIILRTLRIILKGTGQ